MKPLSEHTHDEIKLAVAARYGQVATAPSEKFNFPVGRKFAESVGYDSAPLAASIGYKLLFSNKQIMLRLNPSTIHVLKIGGCGEEMID